MVEIYARSEKRDRIFLECRNITDIYVTRPDEQLKTADSSTGLDINLIYCKF